MLTIIATPIGNLKDVTLRALESLQSVDGIICEDSRRTSILLNHYQINKPMIVLNDFNEAKMFPQILNRLINGENLALVSDAGTPLVSDPGYKLVRECIAQGVTVDSLPGASSILPALTLSGFPPDKFFFLGFFPEKEGKRQQLYQKINQIREVIDTTFIAFVSPYKILKTLSEMEQAFGDIPISLSHELTKIHQEVKTKPISIWLRDLKSPKGEYVLIFG